MRVNQSKPEDVHIGEGYPLLQLAKALTTQSQHPDAATRERAQRRAENWVQVFTGIINGNLAVGSRTPLAGVPEWVTLKVLTGGFATGELLAGGELEPYEQLLLEKTSPVPVENARLALNTYFLSERGLAELQSWLASGAYNINLPEEGALLVVAWLIQNDKVAVAQELLEVLGPWFSRLRFYPIPSSVIRQSGTRVFVQDVGTTATNLQRIGPNPQILAQREMVCVWTPLYDRMVALFLETVSGAPPSLECDANGHWTRAENGKFPVQGGWPCQHYPPGWSSRAAALLEEWDTAQNTYPYCQRPRNKKEHLSQLADALHCCVKSPAALTGRDVGRIRQILACYLTKRGAPASVRCQDLRQRQIQHASAPTHQEIAAALLPRLQAFPAQAGLDDPSQITRPISAGEAACYHLPVGTSIPDALQRKVERCLIETVDILVEKGLITSGEVLARVLPQMTADIRAAGFSDPAARRLVSAIYAAFRRRRSLLLLNLEKQVQIEELPWVSALDRFRQRDLAGRELARQTLEEISILAFSAFPQAILPNKLLQELNALAKTAELDLPLVEEVAADIFMGRFSEKFLHAAHRAAMLLDKTLYASYYQIDYRQLPPLPARPTKKLRLFGVPRDNEANAFAELCARRAGVNLGGWKPAANGMVIEQQQILTSQNLAVLFNEFQVAKKLGERLDELPRCCFAWVCEHLQIKATRWHAHLIQVKNAAYAWRQMIFFLAIRPASVQVEFLAWATDYLSQQPVAFQERFRPALQGLLLALHGQSAENPAGGARLFLGWTQDKHWLLEKAKL
ncbi:MAG: hypothetical protein ACOYYS_14460 [Chloroflexota bacterium]